MSFLFEVSLHKTNCMTIPNIAIVFAPNLMRPKVERIEAILTNSSSVNLIISLLIQHHEVLFHGKEFVDDESAPEVVLSPQLISLKMAQSLHQKTGGSTPDLRTPDADMKPSSPRGEKPAKLESTGESTPANIGGLKKSAGSRKTPGDKAIRRSQTVSSSTTAETKKRIKRGQSTSGGSVEDDFADITVEDLDTAALALEGVSGGKVVRRKKSRRGNMSGGGRDDHFFDTLKKGTMRLAAQLLEEQELVLEMAELDGLTAEEKEAVQAKVVKKIGEAKSLRDNTRKQRQVQRTQTSNFTKLREAGVKSSGHKRSVSSDKAHSAVMSGDAETKTRVKRAKKANCTTGSTEISNALSSPRQLQPSSSVESGSQPDLETSSVSDLPEIDADSANLQFEEELDRQLSLEEDQPLAIQSSSSDDEDSEEFEIINSILPPPLLAPPSAVSGDAAWAGIPLPLPTTTEEAEDSEEERVIEAVMEGDMQQFQEYLGSMKRKKRLERTASNKKILTRMSIGITSSSPQQ